MISVESSKQTQELAQADTIIMVTFFTSCLLLCEMLHGLEINGDVIGARLCRQRTRSQREGGVSIIRAQACGVAHVAQKHFLTDLHELQHFPLFLLRCRLPLFGLLELALEPQKADKSVVRSDGGMVIDITVQQSDPRARRHWWFLLLCNASF